MIGQLELSEAATDRIVVFHHNFFRHDAHIKQIAIKYFLTITEAGIERRARPDSRPAQSHRPFAAPHRHPGSPEYRYGEYVRYSSLSGGKYQLAQVLPSVQPPVPANPIGADNRQINLAISIGIQTALASNLLGAGLQILML